MSTTTPQTVTAVATAVLNDLLAEAKGYEYAHLTDASTRLGLMWRCVCKTPNCLPDTQCFACGEARLWTEEVIPREYDEALLDDLRHALKRWFDKRTHDEQTHSYGRPAAVTFRVTADYDDGLAWAPFGTVLHFTDLPDGIEYEVDFEHEHSTVADALVELDEEDRPGPGETLRIVIPARF